MQIKKDERNEIKSPSHSRYRIMYNNLRKLKTA